MKPHDDTAPAGADEFELTPEEQAALAALPREATAGRLLEERTVRALRERGLVRSGGRLRLPRIYAGAAAAAAVALFAGGMAVGQYLGSRGTERVVAAVQAENARQAALLVQQTGTAYVSALSQLAQAADTSPGAQAQGRAVAVQMLRAAAGELVRIAPDDPVAGSILAGFERAAVRSDSAATRRVVWF